MFGERLKKARQKAGYSQRALAREADIMQYRLSQIETDHAPRMTVDMLVKLCDTLKTTPNDLLGYTPPASHS